LVTILILTQVLNAVLLLPLLFYMYGIAGDRRLMGEFVSSRAILNVYLVVIAIVSVCIGAMLWYSFR
jgi:Mn2+/Fe2+ NRAMP family transporter